jgi:hypothetical protein
MNWMILAIALQDPATVETKIMFHDVRLLTDVKLADGWEFGGEDLVQLIRDFVDKSSWDEEGRSISYQKGTLVLQATEETGRRTSEFLRLLKEAMTRQITVELTLQEMDRGDVDKPDPPHQVLWTGRRTTYSGQTLKFKDSRDISYVRDIDVVQGSSEEIRSVVEEGIQAEVLPVFVESEVQVELNLRQSRLDRMTRFSGVELPEVSSRGLNVTLRVRPGRPVWAGWLPSADPKRLTAVRLQVMTSAKPLAWKVPVDKELVYMLLEIGDLARQGRRPIVRALAGVPREVSRGGATFELGDAETPRISVEEMISELIVQTISPREWEQSDRHSIQLLPGGDALVLACTPATAAKVERFAQELRQSFRRVPLCAELKVVSGNEEFYVKHLRGLGERNVLSEAQERDLLAAAGDFEAVSAFMFQTLGGEGMSGFSSTGISIVTHHEGQKSSDPVIETVEEGLSFLISGLTLDGSRVRAKMQIQSARIDRPIRTEDGLGGKRHSVARESHSAEEDLILEKGRFCVVSIHSKSDGSKHTLILMRVKD